MNEIAQLEEAMSWMTHRDVKYTISVFEQELERNPNNKDIQILLHRAEEILHNGEYGKR